MSACGLDYHGRQRVWLWLDHAHDAKQLDKTV